MAEDEGNNSNIITILLIVSFVLMVYFIYLRGPSTSGIIRIERVASSSIVNTNGSSTAVGVVQGATTNDDPCEKRPQPSYGACGYFLGVYFTGDACLRVYGCGLQRGAPPFSEMSACTAACVPTDLATETE